MSHYTVGKGVIKDVSLLKEVAKKKGIEVVDRKSINSDFAGERNCEFVLSYHHGEAGVIKNPDGSYSILLDNWHNPIVDKIGEDGDILCRDYMVEKAKREAAMLGGVVAAEAVDTNGNVELTIQIY